MSITVHYNLQSYKGLCSRGDGNTQFPDLWVIVLDMGQDLDPCCIVRSRHVFVLFHIQ